MLNKNIFEMLFHKLDPIFASYTCDSVNSIYVCNSAYFISVGMKQGKTACVHSYKTFYSKIY